MAYTKATFGECLIALTDKGICALEFTAPGDGARRLRQLQRQWPAAVWRAQPPRTRRVVERLFTLPRADAAPIDLFVHGSNFQVKVWEALLRIPPGRVSCYEDVARDIGAPTAVRARCQRGRTQSGGVPDPLPSCHTQDRGVR